MNVFIDLRSRCLSTMTMTNNNKRSAIRVLPVKWSSPINSIYVWGRKSTTNRVYNVRFVRSRSISNRPAFSKVFKFSVDKITIGKRDASHLQRLASLPSSSLDILETNVPNVVDTFNRVTGCVEHVITFIISLVSPVTLANGNYPPAKNSRYRAVMSFVKPISSIPTRVTTAKIQVDRKRGMCKSLVWS